MSLVHSKFLTASFLAVIFVTANNVLATPVGNVLFAKGPVAAERERRVGLAKGDEIRVKDTITTGEAGRAHLLMLDGAKFSIRPNSRLKIEEFAFAGSANKRIANLTQGGFRSLSGAIDNITYEVRTPVGVLSVQGTDYTAVFCRSDCNSVGSSGSGEPLEDGLYIGVTDGGISFANEKGEIELGAGEYGFISIADRVPRRLSRTPGVFLDDIQRNGGEGVGESRAGAALRFDGKLGIRREPGKPPLDETNIERGDLGPEDHTAQPIQVIDAEGNLIDITSGSFPQ